MTQQSSRPQMWTVSGSEQIAKDRWIDLRADACIDGQGRAISPYYVLQYGDWISVLALTPAGQAVVVEEYRHGAQIVALGTIGGAVEAGEDAADAASRELREETGYEAREIVALGATWANFGNHTNQVHHFLATGCEPVAAQDLDDTETIAVHVLPLDGLDGHLEQSYHQLTWYKAQAYLRDTAPAS